jgi:pimeloyl-ACP methyl ester carboxylesterase
MKIRNSISSARRMSVGILGASLALILAGRAFASDPATTAAGHANANSATAQVHVDVESFEVGSLQVDRHGERGSPVILVPGLASGAWVWEDTVRGLQDSHVVYVVTLAGFDGRPAQAGKGMQGAIDSLQQLIASRQLEHPVLIGHSLGGVLALALAERQPGLVGGVISIDGLPVFPGTESMTPEQRPAMAAGIKARMAGVDAKAFAAQQSQYMQMIGVIDADTGARLAQLTAKSDPGATADFMADTLALDLRPGLPKISAPVLLLSPYNPADGAAQGITEAAKTDYYRSLMSGTPQLDVQSISPSRHFAMFDQPDKVASAINSFLQKIATH